MRSAPSCSTVAVAIRFVIDDSTNASRWIGIPGTSIPLSHRMFTTGAPFVQRRPAELMCGWRNCRSALFRADDAVSQRLSAVTMLAAWAAHRGAVAVNPWSMIWS